jgi:hypothetical protein
MKISRLFAVAAAIAVTSTVASAQRVEDSQTGMPRVNLISANPIGLLFEWYNGEFEHAVNSTASLAVAASRFDFDGPTYTSIDGIGRYYPSGKALRGFSFGISVGFVDVDANCDGDFCSDEDGTSATVGVRGDYVWILGRDQRFTVATGIGAKRLINDNLGTEGLPIGRLSIGYAW